MCTFRLIFDCSLCARRFTDFTGLPSETSGKNKTNKQKPPQQTKKTQITETPIKITTKTNPKLSLGKKKKKKHILISPLFTLLAQ